DAVSFAPGVPKMFQVTGGTGPITDAIDGTNPDIDTPQSTDFQINVPSSVVTGINKIDNLWLTLHINHQALADLSIQLIAPNNVASIFLTLNRTDKFGNNLAPQGMNGATLGGGGSLDTTFNDAAFFRINEGAEPYRGDWRPEDPTKTLFSAFGALTPAQIAG